MAVERRWRYGLAVLTIGLLGLLGCAKEEETVPQPPAPEVAGEEPASPRNRSFDPRTSSR